MSRQSDPGRADDGRAGPEADTRKVQLVGGSTYSVSLLREWAEREGVEAGSEVYLHPHTDGSLVVRAAPEPAETAEIAVPAGELDADSLGRTVRAMYVAGYDEVTLLADDGVDTDAARAIAEALDTTIGAEIVEERDNKIVVRSFLDPEEVSLRQSVFQLKHAALDAYDVAVSALFGGGGDPARATGRDDEIDRLCGLVARYFQRGLADFSVIDRLGVDRSTLFELYTTSRQLERVAGYAGRLGRLAADGDTLDPALADPAREAEDVVEDATAALLGDADPDVA
ncbi:MAG: AbrB/MazE/SpoVT family DNA-binding domain-containing protein, partial [Halobacteriaceae archaeon]